MTTPTPPAEAGEELAPLIIPPGWDWVLQNCIVADHVTASQHLLGWDRIFTADCPCGREVDWDARRLEPLCDCQPDTQPPTEQEEAPAMDARQLTLAQRAARPVDEHTAALLALMDGDHIHAEDRRRVIDAIVAVASANGGNVDPNDVRRLLTDPWGSLTVYSRVIGATYQALSRRGVLCASGWTTNTDKSGNGGKPLRTYRLT